MFNYNKQTHVEHIHDPEKLFCSSLWKLIYVKLIKTIYAYFLVKQLSFRRLKWNCFCSFNKMTFMHSCKTYKTSWKTNNFIEEYGIYVNTLLNLYSNNKYKSWCHTSIRRCCLVASYFNFKVSQYIANSSTIILVISKIHIIMKFRRNLITKSLKVNK